MTYISTLKTSFNVMQPAINISNYSYGKVYSLSSQTASSIMNFFFRSGHKEGRESLFSNIMIHRAKKSRGSTKTYSANSFKRFKNFSFNAIPYISLSTRRKRRGNLIVNKIKLVDKLKCESKGFGLISKIVFKSAIKSKKLIRSIESQLESINYSKQNSITNVTANAVIRLSRDDIHQKAVECINFG
jgi:hypothetical protein